MLVWTDIDAHIIPINSIIKVRYRARAIFPRLESLHVITEKVNITLVLNNLPRWLQYLHSRMLNILHVDAMSRSVQLLDKRLLRFKMQSY